jgi:glycosyltransferase involved in cell wall biosynthesis
VRFLHSVPDADLPGLYNGAGLLALPSFYEGFGLPVLEAMACGTPVVAADRATLPEVVGDAGLLVNPEDPEHIARALAQALQDEALRAQLHNAGLVQAARFTWERTARTTWAVYRRALGLDEGSYDEAPVSDPPAPLPA